MFEGAFHISETLAPEPVATPTMVERDPEAVIEFLLKKIDEQTMTIDQQATAIGHHEKKAQELEAYAELQAQEIEELRGQLQVTREELDRQLADYDVMMQNALATERELEGYKSKSTEKPRIQLPFHTEQKLAKLGWTETAAPAPVADVEREAV